MLRMANKSSCLIVFCVHMATSVYQLLQRIVSCLKFVLFDDTYYWVLKAETEEQSNLKVCMIIVYFITFQI